MTALNIIYWVLIVLLLISLFAVSVMPHGPVSGVISVALFVVIGLKSFRTPLN